MKHFFLLFILLQIQNCNALNCDSLSIVIKENLNNLSNQSVVQIDSLLQVRHDGCIDNYVYHEAYMKLSQYYFKQNNIEKTILYRKKGIVFGKWDMWNLLDEVAFYLKDNQYDKYMELRRLTDSVFIQNNKEIINVKLNFELSLLLRDMVISDQEVRQREMISRKKKDTIASDSLMLIMKEIDLKNEFLLSFILDNHGYPGFSMVGTQHNAVNSICYHMRVGFQEKYLHLIVQAYLDKELFGGLSTITVLIDKVLYKKFKKTIYHNWEEGSFTKDSVEINEMLKILNIPLLK